MAEQWKASLKSGLKVLLGLTQKEIRETGSCAIGIVPFCTV